MPTNMARNDAEKRAHSYLGEPALEDEPDYPHGLRLRLEEPEVQKFGDEGLAVGETIQVLATVRVDEIGANEDGRSLTLQVVELSRAEADSEGNRETVLYGDK